MSILIKGMEMPKGCGAVTIKVWPNGEVEIIDEDGEWKTTKAVPVPEHGDLIDKGVICKECRRVAEEYVGIYPDCTCCPVSLAPTIIPADQAEEGEG